MKIFMSGRQTGKTTKLVELSAETGATIVVANHAMGKHVELVAHNLDLDIPTPITVANYIEILAKDGLGKTKKYLVDELQMMLYQMNVETATVDENCISNLECYSLLERATKAEKETICNLCADCEHLLVCKHRDELVSTVKSLNEIMNSSRFEYMIACPDYIEKQTIRVRNR